MASSPGLILPALCLVLGIEPDAQYVDQKISLGKNDRLLFYTDGITDALNLHGEFYGRSRLSTVLAKKYNSVKALMKSLVKDLSTWSGPHHLDDDVTLFALGRK